MGLSYVDDVNVNVTEEEDDDDDFSVRPSTKEIAHLFGSLVVISTPTIPFFP